MVRGQPSLLPLGKRLTNDKVKIDDSFKYLGCDVFYPLRPGTPGHSSPEEEDSERTTGPAPMLLLLNTIMCQCYTLCIVTVRECCVMMCLKCIVGFST